MRAIGTCRKYFSSLAPEKIPLHAAPPAMSIPCLDKTPDFP